MNKKSHNRFLRLLLYIQYVFIGGSIMFIHKTFVVEKVQELIFNLHIIYVIVTNTTYTILQLKHSIYFERRETATTANRIGSK